MNSHIRLRAIFGYSMGHLAFYSLVMRLQDFGKLIYILDQQVITPALKA